MVLINLRNLPEKILSSWVKSARAKVGVDERRKAFIFPSEQEDFGIIPVEAMAVGTLLLLLIRAG